MEITKMKRIHTFESFLNENFSQALLEKFMDANGKPMDQKVIVKMIHDALVYSQGKYEKFAEAMSSNKEIKAPGMDPWKVEYEKVPVTDEKTLKTIFDTYRPVSILNENGFTWFINQVYGLVNTKEAAIFNVKITNRVGVEVHLKDKAENVHVANLKNGQSCVIDGGPYSYNNTKGYYYNSAEDVKKLGIGRDKPIDLDIVITPNLWTIEAMTSNGTKVLEKVLNNRKAFDTYSGWYEGDKFCFILFKFKAPTQKLEPMKGDKEKATA
jgi:hypothetical protein